jgi:hypothetical protein
MKSKTTDFAKDFETIFKIKVFQENSNENQYTFKQCYSGMEDKDITTSDKAEYIE